MNKYGSQRLEQITELELQGVGAEKRPVTFAGGPVYHLDNTAYFVDEELRNVWYQFEFDGSETYINS